MDNLNIYLIAPMLIFIFIWIVYAIETSRLREIKKEDIPGVIARIMTISDRDTLAPMRPIDYSDDVIRILHEELVPDVPVNVYRESYLLIFVFVNGTPIELFQVPCLKEDTTSVEARVEHRLRKTYVNMMCMAIDYEAKDTRILNLKTLKARYKML
jgi:hypothetical protein